MGCRMSRIERFRALRNMSYSHSMIRGFYRYFQPGMLIFNNENRVLEEKEESE